MKPEYSHRKHLRNEFVKSVAILLLAVVLLVSAVFAWFGGAVSNIKAAELYLSIISEDSGVELGQDIVTEKSIVLPCATVLSDEGLSINDVSRALKVMPLEVESPVPNNVSITIEVPKNSDEISGLHYYIDTDYVADEDSALSYAETILNNTEDYNDSKRELKYNLDEDDENNDIFTFIENGKEKTVYKHMVAIVFWADYDYRDDSGMTYGQIIDQNPEGLRLNIMMSFKIVSANTKSE